MTAFAIATEPGSLRIAGIVDESCVDGPGLRMTIFAQGCPHKCKGCHNPETHSFQSGQLVALTEIIQNYRQNPLLAGITCSGGEPFCQAQAFAQLAKTIHKLGGNVVTYTGYIYEDLCAAPLKDQPGVSELLAETDFLIDGPFIQELASMELNFRGSSNQRILNLHKI